MTTMVTSKIVAPVGLSFESFPKIGYILLQHAVIKPINSSLARLSSLSHNDLISSLL